MTILARHLIIRGRVQGVFYRSWSVATAQRLGLTGWVCNRLNGDVEALIQGDAGAVADFLALAVQGPPAARVDSVEVENAEPGDLRTFDQRSTA
ncbi:acylphosphatase [Sphingobium nicotianae]|uniref:acylphosphatase n=1 Tax=Sphingobium nicotianae TaxID=2782607 RepID=A0A9X1AJY6_9SPHN|nr:acylphosphatase [Sphingobium nicotianae]MBT2185573.1 acylphosphatase [Sphingobium nicotianae]